MGLFSRKPKSDKNWCVLYMYCNPGGRLYETIKSINESRPELRDSIRINFVKMMHEHELKKYGAKKMRAYFPDQWPAPIYVNTRAGMEETAAGCVRDFIKTQSFVPDAEDIEISFKFHVDGDFVSASFEY